MRHPLPPSGYSPIARAMREKVSHHAASRRNLIPPVFFARPAGRTTTSTSRPKVVSISNNRSMEKPRNFPRSRFERSGWATPVNVAALAWVSFFSFIRREISLTIWAFSKRSSALGRPRSAKMLPLKTSCAGSFGMGCVSVWGPVYTP